MKMSLILLFLFVMNTANVMAQNVDLVDTAHFNSKQIIVSWMIIIGVNTIGVTYVFWKREPRGWVFIGLGVVLLLCHVLFVI